MLDTGDELVAAVAAGEGTAADAAREFDICMALNQLFLMDPADEQLFALWPEACRRAGVPVVEMPIDLLYAVLGAEGRPGYGHPVPRHPWAPSP